MSFMKMLEKRDVDEFPMVPYDNLCSSTDLNTSPVKQFSVKTKVPSVLAKII